MNLRIVFKFKDCKLQFYEKRRLFSYFSVNPRTPASRQRRLLKLKRKKINSFKIIIGFFFTSPLFLATKVAISFVYYSPKTIKCTQKPKIEKKFTGIDQSSELASECHPPHPIYNSLLCMRAIHELKNQISNNVSPAASQVSKFHNIGAEYLVCQFGDKFSTNRFLFGSSKVFYQCQ